MSVKKLPSGRYAVIVGTHATRAAAMRQDKAAGRDKSARQSIKKGVSGKGSPARAARASVKKGKRTKRA